MNIKIQKKDENLNEDVKVLSKQETKNGHNKVSDKKKMFEMILNVKSKQVIFSCGAIMGKIDVVFDEKIALNYHYMASKNFNEFIDSVREFLAISDCKIEKTDLQMLESQYKSMEK